MGAVTFLVVVVLPATELICLALAIAWRSRSPLWLAVLGTLPLAVLAVITAIETWGSTGMGQIGWTFAVWFAFAAVLGAIGGVAIVGGWPSRAYWLIGAFAVPVPFLALVLFLAAMDLFGH